MSENNQAEATITQIKELASAHKVSFRSHAPGSAPRGVVRKGGGPSLAFDSAIEYIWLVVGNTQNIAAFLGAISVILPAYFKNRSARVIKISDGKRVVEIKGSGDVKKAIDAFNSIEKKEP